MASEYIIDLPFIDFAGKSANIDHWHNPDYNWRDGLWATVAALPALTGPLRFAGPIDMIHWQIEGNLATDPVEESWTSCTELLMHL